MKHYENINHAPQYLQAIFKLVGFDYGEFSCMRDATDTELFQLVGLIQAEIAFRSVHGESCNEH